MNINQISIYMEDKTLVPGTVLRGETYTYTIQKVLGQGSFGITYLATTQVKVAGALGALETTMQVAVKEFFMREVNGREGSTVTTGSQGGLYEKYKEKFIRESRNLSRLDHPHIVKVLEAFEANNTAYYSMEFLDGGSLDRLIAQKGGLPEAECVKYVRQIGGALSYMHAHKMLHLDLKPGNLMLRRNGDVVLIDFGLSKQYDKEGKPETSTTVGGGTPGYAPIEQVHYREGKDFPVTMDVYALGATLFKMLTGVCPPEASEILNDGFPAYELQKRKVSEALIACMAKAMAARKSDRYQSVQAMLDGLEKESAGGSGHGADGSEGTEFREDKEEKKERKKPVNGGRKYAVGGLAIGLAIGLGIYWMMSRSASSSGTVAEEVPAADTSALVAAVQDIQGTLSPDTAETEDVSHEEPAKLQPEEEEEAEQSSPSRKPEKKPDKKPQPNKVQPSTTVKVPVTLAPGEDFDYVGEYADGLAVVRHKGKYGFVNEEKEIVIPIQYDAVGGEYDFQHNYNVNDKEVWFPNFLMPVCRNGKWGLIDREGKEVIPLIYDDVDDSPFVPISTSREEYYWAKKGDLYGCVTLSGDVVIPFVYQSRINFYGDEPAKVKKDGKWGFINRKNETVVPFIYDSTRGFGYNGTLAQVSRNGKYGFIDREGNVRIPLQFDFADDFEGGLAGVVKDGKLGFVDEQGTLVIPYRYDVVKSSDGDGSNLSLVQFTAPGVSLARLDGKWGLIDKTGKAVTPFKYDDVRMTSSSGCFCVMLDGKEIYLDSKGREYKDEQEARAHNR